MPVEGGDARRAKVIGALMVAFAAVTFSGKAIIVKLAYRYGVDSLTLLALRMLFSAPLFLALAWWAGRRERAHIEPADRRAVGSPGTELEFAL